jgi:tripartite-type tricarboxylate transporter receptor subunit TctC
VLVVTSALPVKTVKELIAYAKANPGKLTFYSVGPGSAHHLIGEWINSLTGAEMVHVPYKGGAPQIAALLGGEIQSSMDVYATSNVHVRSGKFKVLGVASAKRFSLTPDVPTLGEQGFPVEGGTFFALLGPAKLPPEIVTTLNRAVNTVLDMPDVRERLAAIGVEQVGGSSEVLASTIRNELQKWARLVQARNLKFD